LDTVKQDSEREGVLWTCIHPGLFNKESIKEERGEDVCIVSFRTAFDNRKRKSEENEWNWKGRKKEQVNKFKYLDYTFNERATDKVHIREIVRKANKVVGCV
jgi:hypothetical protein